MTNSMKWNQVIPAKFTMVSTGLVLACLLAGCEKKADATAELEKAATEMQKTETAPAAPTPSVYNGNIATTQPVAPAQEMNQAVASFKAGNLDDAVKRLQRLRAAQALTPEQRIALNDAMAAVMSEISSMAAQGDPRAVAALKQYEQMRNQPR
jgi:hypothetical protein